MQLNPICGLRRAAGVALLLLLVCPSGATAQKKSAEPTAPGAQDEAEFKGDLTTLLLSSPRPGNAAVHRNDPDVLLREPLRNLLTDPGHFRVFSFSLDNPVIKEAIKQRLLDASEFAEPLKTEALEHAARVMGARYILVYHSALDKNGMKTDMRFLEAAGPQDWTTAFANQVTIDAKIGKRRLKPEEMA